MRPPGKLVVAVVLVVLVGGAFLSGVPPSEAASAKDVQDGVRLLSATGEGLAFEVKVPWERLRLEPVTAGGREYVRVSMSGWAATAQAGAPLLPQVAQAIGVPFGAKVSVEVQPGPAHTLLLPAPVLPVATQRVGLEPPVGAAGVLALPAPTLTVEEDPAISSGGVPYPRVLAEVASDGVLRQQRVAGIVIYPVQYSPAAHEITVYESLRVEVRFEGIDGMAAAGSEAADSAAYEQMFGKELLNYEAARAWRRTAATDPSPNVSERSSAGAEGAPWAPPVPGWRVKVRVEGLYKLSYAELLGQGLPVASLDPRTFRLYNLGREVAVYVSGEADGEFDETDYLVFYGQAVASKYTADNVYWLTFGQGTGLRIASRNGAPGDAGTPLYYPARRYMEGNGYYVPLAPGDDALERWLWDYVYPPSRPSWSYSFALVAPYAGTFAAKLRVSMLGYLRSAITPDHHATISLNGAQVGEVRWDGVTWQVVEMQIAQSMLVAGHNTLTVTCPNDTGVGYDLVYVDSAELEFANTFVAEGDVLLFGYDATGSWTFQVDGFSSPELAVYDVTDPASLVQIEGVDVVASGSTWNVQFQDSLAAPARYLAMTATAYRTVQAIEADTPSTLQSTANGADYIVISHKDFSTQAAQLSAFRASQGLRAQQVHVQDVYDEFGYGIEGAEAIHDFLAYAYGHWQSPAPSYVVLLGDGHYDPKNYAGYGRMSYLPPYLAAVDPWITETAADNRYVTLVGGDTMPDMMLGRLAVNSTSEAAAFVNKIVAYEQSPVAGVWQKQVLAVADNADGAGDFAQVSDDLLARYLPAPYQAEKVYYGITHQTVAEARSAIQAGIDAGKLIVNYVGHAAVEWWASERLFEAADVGGLANGGKLPVVLAMTCYDGYYLHPQLSADGYDATAEVLTRADGRGAVASWSPTGLGIASGHDYLNSGFFEALFRDGVGTVGKATAAGKLKLWATGTSLDLLDTYLLFGDPAQRFAGFPPAVVLTSFAATGAKKAITLDWETAGETDNLGFNLYRAEAVDGPRTKINASLIPSRVVPGSSAGAVYSFQDAAVTRSGRYMYWLATVGGHGPTGLYGPLEAQVKYGWQVNLPAISVDH